jgi:hypothetical protein
VVRGIIDTADRGFNIHGKFREYARREQDYGTAKERETKGVMKRGQGNKRKMTEDNL